MSRSISSTLKIFMDVTIEETVTSPQGGVMYLIVLGKLSEGDALGEFIIFADGDIVEL